MDDEGSCSALNAVRSDVDAFLADLLEASLAVKRQQRLTDNAEAFDYTVSFLSGAYRALALVARNVTIEAMD